MFFTIFFISLSVFTENFIPACCQHTEGLWEEDKDIDISEGDENRTYAFNNDHAALTYPADDNYRAIGQAAPPSSSFGFIKMNSINPEDIKFRLYTSKDPKKSMRICTKKAGIEATEVFLKGSPLKILLHGFNDDPTSWLIRAKNEYLKGGSFNVIVVDWSPLCQSNSIDVSTITNIYVVAKQVAKIIDSLVNATLVKPEEIHIAAHSYGAQVAGLTVNLVRSGVVGRVTALDPGRPFFDGFATDYRLDPEDAPMVDVIYTDAGGLGFLEGVGTIEFYPNGGSHEIKQPGCERSSAFSLFGDSCSHSRATLLFLASINNPTAFKSYKCENYHDYYEHECNLDTFTYMGEHASKTAVHGKYFLKTTDKAPYYIE